MRVHRVPIGVAIFFLVIEIIVFAGNGDGYELLDPETLLFVIILNIALIVVPLALRANEASKQKNLNGHPTPVSSANAIGDYLFNKEVEALTSAVKNNDVVEIKHHINEIEKLAKQGNESAFAFLLNLEQRVQSKEEE